MARINHDPFLQKYKDTTGFRVIYPAGIWFEPILQNQLHKVSVKLNYRTYSFGNHSFCVVKEDCLRDSVNVFKGVLKATNEG